MEQPVQNERDLLEQVNGVNTPEDYIAWVQRCNEYIEQLEQHSRVKRPRLVAGNGQSLVAEIARLEGLKKQLERRFTHIGGGGGGGGDYASGSSAGLFWRGIDTAFKNRVLTGAVINADYIEPRQFLQDARDIVLEHVQNVLQEHDNIKINTIFNGEFVTGDKRANKSINTRNYELFRLSDLREWYESHVIEPTLTSLEEFQERDSGWALSRILNLTVNVNKYNPLHAGCHLKLPREIMLKRAVVNVQSADNACFAWSVVAALYPAQRNTDRQSSYPHYTAVLNLQDIEFPMSLKKITTFERLNNVSINVYTIEELKKLNILPIRLTDQKKDKHVNLLYMQDPRDDNVGHFAWIKNLSRLVSSQLSRYEHKKYFCDR